jgi:hypothetical protein
MSLDEFSGHRSELALAAGREVLNVVIDFTDFRLALEGCISMIHTVKSLVMPSGILILGEPGMGKTLLLSLIRAHLQRNAGLASDACYLDISLDSGVDVHRMAAATMFALGYPMLPSRPNLDNMNQMVAKGLERKLPQVMLLDEMQHVCEGNRDITARAVTDWLKVRMDRHNLLIIGVGTRALERLSLINPQFTSRVSATFVLTPFAYGDSWRQLLGGFAAQVKTVDLDLINGPLSRPIHAATKGNLRALKRLLTYAAMHATLHPRGIVTKADLSKAFQDANGSAPDRVNPFL